LWIYALFAFIATFAAVLLDEVIASRLLAAFGRIWCLYVVALFVPGLGIGVRRLTYRSLRYRDTMADGDTGAFGSVTMFLKGA